MRNFPSDRKPDYTLFADGMRCLASKNFFEQIKGRGVRVVSDTEMGQFNPSVNRETRYPIVDAVGVTERMQTESHALENKSTASFEKLLDAPALGTTEVAAVESLAGRLIRLEGSFDAEVEAEEVKTDIAKPSPPTPKSCWAAIDADEMPDYGNLLEEPKFAV